MVFNPHSDICWVFGESAFYIRAVKGSVYVYYFNVVIYFSLLVIKGSIFK